jgi:hypothetical protein
MRVKCVTFQHCPKLLGEEHTLILRKRLNVLSVILVEDLVVVRDRLIELLRADGAIPIV